MIKCNNATCPKPDCVHAKPHKHGEFSFCWEDICNGGLVKCVEIELPSFEILEDGSIK